ncbi:MAG: AbrB/MazE/SpoVT family DNA-binding domain-containing protein [Nitrospirae bacterium]|nr:AbrB/MazE/SpoVT family DNA-binding domain-containing protein [Nitrospirota bacterium]
MTKKLTKHGNSLALVIDKGVLDVLNIDDKTPLNITTDCEALIITPVKNLTHQKAFEEALSKTNQKFGLALKNLTD